MWNSLSNKILMLNPNYIRDDEDQHLDNEDRKTNRFDRHVTGKIQSVVTGKINMIYLFNIYYLLCTRNWDHREKDNRIPYCGKTQTHKASEQCNCYEKNNWDKKILREHRKGNALIFLGM